MNRKLLRKKVFDRSGALAAALLSMIENEGGVYQELPGCCGVRVLHGFDDTIEGIVDNIEVATEEYNEQLADFLDGEGDSPYLRDDYTPRSWSEVHEAFSRVGLVIATTIPSQKLEREALTLCGFLAIEEFRNPNTSNTITVWHWRNPKTRPRSRR